MAGRRRAGSVEAQAFYDGLGCDYDLMVAWEERLAREGSFFSRLFAERGARRVLDAACGTGMHVIAFARAGRDCTGVDLSPVMVETARKNARDAGVRARFEVADFGGLRPRFGGLFDAVTCIGNSLPHLLDDESLRTCLADFAALLVPGGVLVIQNRNYDRLLRERQRFMPPVSRVEGDGETLFLRITEYPPAGAPADEVIDFTLLTLRRRSGEWSVNAQSTPLRAMRRSTLETALSKAGFASVRSYGNYALADYDSSSSGDLVIVATRDESAESGNSRAAAAVPSPLAAADPAVRGFTPAARRAPTHRQWTRPRLSAGSPGAHGRGPVEPRRGGPCSRGPAS